jgi:putative ABC transport system ATP-binding protein
VTAREVLGLLRHAVDVLGATVVMVTHDPVAASYADRVLFLADGSFADELPHPDPSAVADRMVALTERGAGHGTGRGTERGSEQGGAGRLGAAA